MAGAAHRLMEARMRRYDNKFARISDIDINQPESWRGRIFLTFDIDWAADFVLQDTIDLIEGAGVCATWFATHSTPLLENIRRNPLFELGVHPNFNPLLAGAHAEGVQEILDRTLELAPGCVSVRSHSLVQATSILNMFGERRLRYDCNMLVPWDAGIVLQPWRHWTGDMVRVPYLWEDDVACLYDWEFDSTFDYWYQPDGINVLDFHPIHVYMNTESLRRYEDSREVHRNPVDLIRWRNTSAGSRTFLQSLLARNI